MAQETVHIVGSGLVGPLAALFLRQAQVPVELYERRPDLRKSGKAEGRSINLAMNERGLRALDCVGLKSEVMNMAIPMRGRMLHDVTGKTTFVPYGQENNLHEAIFSVSRGALNAALLNEAERNGITINFNHVCCGYDNQAHSLNFENGRTVSSAVTLGTDGASSSLRKSMINALPGFENKEEVLGSGYKELSIPADGGNFVMETEALHIWPRGEFMLIALPNMGGSFTCTLFAPNAGENSFEQLQESHQVEKFFMQHFPDAVPLMPTLVRDFQANPLGSLTTVKCSPWNMGGELCLMGDAAHAIVPFSGQGANIGFEDCRILFNIIKGGGRVPDWRYVFNLFSALRRPDTGMIADKSLANFREMRQTTGEAEFQFRKLVGLELERRYPELFIPLYTMITHRSDIRQSAAAQRDIIQQEILDELQRGIALDNIERAVNQVDWEKAGKLVSQRLQPIAPALYYS